MDNKKEYYSYVEELYKEAAGRGIVDVEINNDLYQIKEYFKFDKIIGKSNIGDVRFTIRPIPPEKSNYTRTHKIQIIYSSKGYHIVPIDERNERWE